jgi:hypothetical protein
MTRKIVITHIVIIMLCLIALPCLAGMTSQNYKIPSSVIAGGGGVMVSASYHINGTLGQPSPLLDPSNPSHSANYKLYSGFWYTFSEAAVCECDLNHDGRCDMRDWLLFGQRWGATNCLTVPCACDLNGDGRCDMRDWLLFGKNWGRTNCPIQ